MDFLEYPKFQVQSFNICAEIAFFFKFAPNLSQNVLSPKKKFSMISLIRETKKKSISNFFKTDNFVKKLKPRSKDCEKHANFTQKFAKKGFRFVKGVRKKREFCHKTDKMFPKDRKTANSAERLRKIMNCVKKLLVVRRNKQNAVNNCKKSIIFFQKSVDLIRRSQENTNFVERLQTREFHPKIAANFIKRLQATREIHHKIAKNMRVLSKYCGK